MSVSIAAGSMNKRVEIQTSVTTRDEYGAPVTTWPDDGEGVEVWAKVESTHNVDLWSSAGTTHIFRMRPHAALVYGTRLAYDGRYFVIQHLADVDEAGAQVVVYAKEDTRRS